MPNKSDLQKQDTNRIHVVFEGASGSMKTYAASSFPKPYIFDFDQGLKTIRGVPWDFEYDSYTNNIDGMMRKLQEFEKNCPYETLIFDSTTMMSQDILLLMCKMNGHLDSYGNPNDKVGILEYGQRVKWMTSFVISLRKFPVNVVLVCHEETYKDDTLGLLVTRPSVPGESLPDQLPVFFDEFWRFEILRNSKNEAEVTVNTVGSARFLAKTRLGLPPKMTFKWGDNFYNILKGEIEKLPKFGQHQKGGGS